MTPQEIEALPYRPCVGVMVLNQAGKVFVGQRSDNSSDAWQMPQGGIEADETPREAAMRELTEETGIAADKVSIAAEMDDWVPYDLPHDLVPQLWGGRFRGQQQKWFLLRFEGSDADVDITAHDKEFSAWRWMDPGDLIGNIVPFKRNVYEAVMTSFEPML